MSSSGDATFEEALTKRYESLTSLRGKANKGKGAWYWAYFEPILVTNPDSAAPKAVKLKCCRCGSVFSASNPSRTASEHLKRGSCPNFAPMLKPISQLTPQNRPPEHFSGTKSGVGAKPSTLSPVKKHKTLKKKQAPPSSPVPPLSPRQADVAFSLLSDWFFQVCGSVSLSSLQTSSFNSFLAHVGLPRFEFSDSRLDSKFQISRDESEARIREAAFFQISSDGWKSSRNNGGDRSSVKFTVNLPNGTTIFHKLIFPHYDSGGVVPSQYIEEVFSDAIRGVCGGVENLHKCVGIVSDRFKSTALKNLEGQNDRLVNVSCLAQGFLSLLKDLYRELPFIRSVSDDCLKIANLVNSHAQIRNYIHKFRSQHHGTAAIFIRAPHHKKSSDMSKNISLFVSMLEDILSCSQLLHVVFLDDDSCKSLDESASELIRYASFWKSLEAVHSLFTTIMSMASEVKDERPLLGRCLPLWKELKAKIKEWESNYGFIDARIVEKIVEKRFWKCYHPSWAAAFILDPLHLVRDSTGKYLPPFSYLTQEQEKDVDRLVMKLVSFEEPHVVLMELMKWRSEGLDPLYAQAVQVRKKDPVTGKMKVVNPSSSRLVWETCLHELKSVGRAAVRLLFLHATSSSTATIAPPFDYDAWSSLGAERAHKLSFVAANAGFRPPEAADKDVEVV
ncbi:hypothetical protein M569_05645 [Genlisea aurea]|uniref:DUF7963 domain-containing protein n=1 Tax=Genlisea aurea TaxID=192259 RepID=S8CPL4_9LAMI|nr:hypothetical protein M569_05645 [Genlisea aurea]